MQVSSVRAQCPLFPSSSVGARRYRAEVSQRVRDGLAGICLGAAIGLIGLLMLIGGLDIGLIPAFFGGAAIVFGLGRVGMGLLAQDDAGAR